MSSASADSTPSVADGYTLHHGYPPVPAYMHLRSASGLSPVTAEQAEHVAKGSWFGCHIVHNDTSTPVAMGRIIGDGGWYFHVADMATLPDHQRKGFGNVILHTLLAKIREKAPPGAYVNLIADKPGWKLYEKHGFQDVAGYQKNPERGMWQVLK
ncbi:hypothetical protein FH972_022716 [Carpinus fangiana]|uniref:N-acetyltransferase domain-containing protein n=1 Tax=Carpinus fangiana TaxID=176857 RepID=A0A5N6KV96_9ROSI|nr:hypothetical protein FH972_022716 [Carpinus fangiana]